MNGIIKNSAASTQLLRKVAVIGISATALLMLATTAQATDLITNGSFEENAGSSCSVGTSGCATDWGSTGYNFLFINATSAQTTPIDTVSLWGPLSGDGGSANGFGPSPDGGAFLGLDGDFDAGPVTQTISGLTAGDTYAVSFYWAASQQEGFNGPTIQAMNVCLGSSAESYVDTGDQPLSGGTNASSNISCSGSGASTALIDLPSHEFSGWQSVTVDLTANSTSDVLSFLAYGNIQEPPFALLDGVSMNLAPTPEPGTLPLLFTGLMGGVTVLRSRKWLKR
jgi:hypothetical protein